MVQLDMALFDTQKANPKQHSVRNGGRAILGGFFAGDAPNLTLSSFFATTGLDWHPGSYHRTTFEISLPSILYSTNNNPEKTAQLLRILPACISARSIHIRGRDVNENTALYRPMSNGTIETLTSRMLGLPAKPVTNVDESPCVLARVGQGFLGYVGDVDMEEGSIAATLGMCGVLKDGVKIPKAEAVVSTFDDQREVDILI